MEYSDQFFHLPTAEIYIIIFILMRIDEIEPKKKLKKPFENYKYVLFVYYETNIC